MKKLQFILLSMALAACSSGSSDYDATGMFEATELIVSAEQNGRLLSFTVEEGDRLQTGSQVGLIDTVQLQLRALQLGATKDVYATQRPDIETQIAAMRQELVKAEAEQRRYEALVKDNAANRKMLDDAVSNVRVLRRRLAAQQSSLGKSTSSLNSQMTATEIQRREVIDQLRKCHVVSPISGTVLEKYAEQGEYATMGKPLFKIADVVDMKLRAYVTASQLNSIQTGQKVRVYADEGEDKRREYQGVITWISDKAEFTPKTIQTRDERSNLVYAVKISVRNTDGLIKIGMYGDVRF